MRIGPLAPAALLAALAMAAPRAEADGVWTPIAQTEDSVFLLDEGSVEFRSGLVTAVELVEYAWPQHADGVRYMSQVNLRAYRCDERTWDVLRITRHSEPRGTGEVVLAGTFTPSQATWNRAAPESVADIMLRHVCALASDKGTELFSAATGGG
jgi:hypothetical protein